MAPTQNLNLPTKKFNFSTPSSCEQRNAGEDTGLVTTPIRNYYARNQVERDGFEGHKVKARPLALQSWTIPLHGQTTAETVLLKQSHGAIVAENRGDIIIIKYMPSFREQRKRPRRRWGVIS